METIWIARDKDGYLYLYEKQPHLSKLGNDFVPSRDSGCMLVNANMFPEITFKSSPKEVELSLK